ncbi:hypothetical protein P7H19_10625 [Paenibacillus larvae]|nr:hypothetical protein [Paenibacillus larvae]MDT2236660.1 hypothetical protein [Paenibacillus larvae]
MEKFFKINDDLIQLLSNAEVAITKHGDAHRVEQVGQKICRRTGRGSQERSPPRNNQGGHELAIKSTPKNTRLQLTSNKSVTSLNDALIKRAGLEYDIKTLEETQQRLREQGNESAVRSYDQLIKRKKDELGARREADRQRKRKAEEITRRCWS